MEESCTRQHLVVTLTANPPTVRVVGPVAAETVWRMKAALQSELTSGKGWSELREKPLPHWIIRFDSEHVDPVIKTSFLLLQIIETLETRVCGKWMILDSHGTADQALIPGANAACVRHPFSDDPEKASFTTTLFFERIVETKIVNNYCKHEASTPSEIATLSSKGKGVTEEHKELKLMLQGIEAGYITVNMPDADGQTALHLACSIAQRIVAEDAKENITFLLEMGANPMLLNRDKVRPVDYALRQSVPHSENNCLLAINKYLLIVHKKLMERKPPDPIAELNHSDISDCCFSRVVSSMVYYSSDVSASLCCRDLVGCVSAVVFTPLPPGSSFIVIPYSDSLHTGRVLDYILLSNGYLLKVDHRTSEPITTQYQTDFRCKRRLSTMIWVDDSIAVKQKLNANDTQTSRRKLRPTYLDAMKKELDSLEEEDREAEKTKIGSRSRSSIIDSDTDISLAFAKNLLLYPHNQIESSQEENTKPVPDTSDLATQTSSSPGCWVGILAAIVTQSELDLPSGEVAPDRMVCLYIPPLCGTTTDSGKALSDAIQKGWSELPFIKKRESDQPLRSLEFQLTQSQVITCIGSSSSPGQGIIAIGSESGGYGVYNSVTMDFSYVEVDPSEMKESRGNLEADTEPLNISSIEVQCSNSITTVILFSKGISIFEAKLPQGNKGSSPLVEKYRFSRGLETCSGIFHPNNKNLIIYFKDGIVYCYCTKLQQVCCVAPLLLTTYEVDRKKEDDDASDVATLRYSSGTQHLSFSSDGEYLMRRNEMYHCVSIYSWSPFFKNCITRMHQAMSVDNTPVDIYCPLLQHCIPKTLLKAFLSQQHSSQKSVIELTEQLVSFYNATESWGLPTSFCDADGRTAIHLGMILASATDLRISQYASEVVTKLLQKQCNLFTCDYSQLRPYDALNSSCGGTLQLSDSTSTNLALKAVIQYKQNVIHELSENPVLLNVVSELSDRCSQASFSGFCDSLVYFTSLENDLYVVNIEKRFSARIGSYPETIRMAVFPYSIAMHGPHRCKDFIILSNGLILVIDYINGITETPIVSQKQTLLRADVLVGANHGCCLAVSCIRTKNYTKPQKGHNATSYMDYSMGAVAAICYNESTDAREIRVLQISSILYSDNKTGLDFICGAIDMGWVSKNALSTVISLPSEVIPSQMSATNTEKHTAGYVMTVLECPYDGITVGYVQGPNRTILIQSSRFSDEGCSVGCSIKITETDDDKDVLTAVRCSRSIEIFQIFIKEIDNSSASRIEELSPIIDIPGCDHMSEPVSATFCNKKINTHDHLLYIREGTLFIIDIQTKSITEITRTVLSTAEQRRKLSDGDDPSEVGVSGYQLLNMSGGDEYLFRLNTFYETVVLYEWDSIKKRLESGFINNAVPLQMTPEDRPPRRIELRGSLRRMSTINKSLREKRHELLTLIDAITAGMVNVNFVDSDGKSTCHIACDIAHLLPAAESVNIIYFLITKGANLYLCDNTDAHSRPIDILFSSGSQRENLSKAISRYQQQTLHTELPVPDEPKYVGEDYVLQVSVSEVSPCTFFVMSLQDSNQRTLNENRYADRLTKITSYNVETNTVGVVRDSMRGTSFKVIPHSKAIHGTTGGIDFIITQDMIISVLFTSKGTAIDEHFIPIVDLFPGLSPVSGDLDNLITFLWAPDTISDEQDPPEEYRDMFGSVAYPCDNNQFKIMRIPRIEHDDRHRAKYFIMLMKLSSPVEVTVGFKEGDFGDCLKIATSSWHRITNIGLYYIVAAAPPLGCQVTVISHRGTVLQQSFEKDMFSSEPATLMNLTNVANDNLRCPPHIRPLSTPFRMYAQSEYFVVVTCFSFKLYKIDLVFAAESKQSSNTISFINKTKIIMRETDTLDCMTAMFVPGGGDDYLYLLVDNELLGYSLRDDIMCALGTLGLHTVDRQRLSFDGDKTESKLIGELSLKSSFSGRFFSTFNSYTSTFAIYDVKSYYFALESTLSRPVVSQNAIYVELLCLNQKTAKQNVKSIIQPHRVGNNRRKESLVGYYGRLSTLMLSSRGLLMKMITGIRKGIPPNLRDADKRTALHHVFSLSGLLCGSDIKNMTAFLLNLGASLFVSDSQGKTPIDLIPQDTHTPPDTSALQAVIQYHSSKNILDNLTVVAAGGALFKYPSVIVIEQSSIVNAGCYAVCERDGATLIVLLPLNKKPEPGWSAPTLYHTTEETGSSLRVITATHHNYKNTTTDILLTSTGDMIKVTYSTTGSYLSHQTFECGLTFFVDKTQPLGHASSGYVSDSVISFTLTEGNEIKLFSVEIDDELDFQKIASEFKTQVGSERIVKQLVGNKPVAVSQVKYKDRLATFVLLCNGDIVLIVDEEVCLLIGGYEFSSGISFSSCFSEGQFHFAIYSEELVVSCVSLDSINFCTPSVENILKSKITILSVVSDNSTSLISGCFHPSDDLFIFIKDNDPCVYNLVDSSFTLIGPLDRSDSAISKNEVEKSSSSLTLISFSQDGQGLLCNNIFNETLSVYNWTDVTTRLEELSLQPKIGSNAVFLPPQIGEISVRDVYEIVKNDAD